MNFNVLALTIAAIAGLVMGLVYFGGLWLSVRQLPDIERPCLLFWGSCLLRSAIVLGGFYLILRYFANEPLIIVLLTCVLGFLIPRNILIYLITTFSAEPHRDRERSKNQ